MKNLKSLFGASRKKSTIVQFYHNPQNRFAKSMPGESGALASLRLGQMAL